MLSEDIAEYYLKNLIGRNLVIISKKSCDGKTKTCRIHDLLHDFCKKKAKVEKFLQCIKGDNDSINPSSISYQKHSIPRRLCLNFQGDNLVEWSSICSNVQSFHSVKGRQIALSSIHHASYTFNSLDQVATLPTLVVLKLLQVTFCSRVWEVTDEQFPQLKFLKVQVPNFSEWEVSDDAFPCLEHLLLRRLRNLEEIPSHFADMLTLKSIEVISCKESLVESAKDIREIQVEEMQNCGFKLDLIIREQRSRRRRRRRRV